MEVMELRRRVGVEVAPAQKAAKRSDSKDPTCAGAPESEEMVAS